MNNLIPCVAFVLFISGTIAITTTCDFPDSIKKAFGDDSSSSGGSSGGNGNNGKSSSSNNSGNGKGNNGNNGKGNGKGKRFFFPSLPPPPVDRCDCGGVAQVELIDKAGVSILGKRIQLCQTGCPSGTSPVLKNDYCSNQENSKDLICLAKALVPSCAGSVNFYSCCGSATTTQQVTIPQVTTQAVTTAQVTTPANTAETTSCNGIPGANGGCYNWGR